MKNLWKFLAFWHFRRKQKYTMPLDLFASRAYAPMETAITAFLWERLQGRLWDVASPLREHIWKRIHGTQLLDQRVGLRYPLSDQLEDDWSRNRPV